ncbi:helix-turn-helix domain-containing protein [Haloarcula sp. S1AR25-5A]|uniref:Helix-turn-helix domain-containing protein n=1 Tax=Haloarcula terrestris TaxID=2950533 RepID=A0AAE4EWV0_9EURY|nr:MarR family transcriptional regulator [Haloarcula terrestris]MDS0221442.1 helix-turn-helix domain-containing protein [Haloarcula terrestris]
MDEPLDRVAFLANSPNRIRVLETLATGPHTRAELAAQTDVARATLSRILSEFEDREWIEHPRDRYVATPQGVQLVRAVRSLTETVEALDRLGEQVQWFPIEHVDFDVGELHDATIVRPDATDNVRPLTRSLEHIRQAETVRLVASQHAPPALAALWQATVVDRRLTLDGIVATPVFDAIRDSETDAQRMREMVATDRVRFFRGSGLPACNCVDNDGTIIFALRDDNGASQALVETESQAVREWFDAFFDRHREAAAPITAADLDE